MAFFSSKQDKDQLKLQRGEMILKTPLMYNYMGGYGEYKKATGTLQFYTNQIEFSSPLSTKFTVATTQIAEATIEGKDDVSKRVTVTRLLAVGIFAFALKKGSKEREAYLTIVLKDGQEIIFHINGVAPRDLQVKLAKLMLQLKQANPSPDSQANTLSVADEIKKLADLKEQGILTQAEFDKKKLELLG